MIRRIICFLFLFPLGLSAALSQIMEEQVDWKAWWVTHPSVQVGQFNVIYARNQLNLDVVPDTLQVNISADIRYKLFLNGKYIGQGPANNDLLHYSYDTYNLAAHASVGKNVLALQVFSLGKSTPVRFETSGIKFIVQAGGDWGKHLNTGSGSWKVYNDRSIQPTLRNQHFKVDDYFAMGGGEFIQGKDHPWGWNESSFNDSDWENARRIQKGEIYGNNMAHGETIMTLSPRSIPAMDESALPKPIIRIDWNEDGGELTQTEPQFITVPKNSQVSYLLDQKLLAKGFPEYIFSHGKDAEVTVTYAESLYGPDGKKGDRDQVKGKKIYGLTDIYHLDGGQLRSFSPLLQRVWRYILVEITTKEEDLVWEDFQATQFVYPFKNNASFQSPFAVHNQIWESSWRTALLCTDETYMDCPYYEQLQYVGDTRIQALVSLYVSGDDRLVKNSITQFSNSFTDEGITQGRFPSAILQYIPPYSLFWVNMVYDYHYHGVDMEFSKSHLRKVEMVLSWFEEKLQKNRLLGPMPWWSYVDVTPDFNKGNPTGAIDGNSVILTLQYLYTLQQSVELFEYYGKDRIANHYNLLAGEIQRSINDNAFDSKNGLYTDTPDKDSFSQHANILAILTDTAPESLQAEIFETITTRKDLTKSNIYFKFYLHRAALKSGNGDYFIENLETWTDMLDLGLTTFAEHETDARSDCHAWSASPSFEFIHTVAGIRPSKPHFKEVLIAPNLGSLPELKAEMPHHKGKIAVELTRSESSVTGHVNLPKGITGSFQWKGNEIQLSPGENKISIP